MANTALIKYYAKLMQRGTFKEQGIPEEYRDEVMKVYNSLPPLPPDPDTQTPAIGQEDGSNASEGTSVVSASQPSTDETEDLFLDEDFVECDGDCETCEEKCE